MRNLKEKLMLASMLLAPSSHDEVDVVGKGKDNICNEPSANSAFKELLDVTVCATARLDLAWRGEKQKVARGRLDEQFMSGHNHQPSNLRPSPMSLLFLPEFHAGVEKSWKKPYLAYVFLFPCKCGWFKAYVKMPH